ncbi:MAG: hypothetical protein U0610_18605 [bacterium]
MRRMIVWGGNLVVALALATLPLARAQAADAFDARWRDGRAEIDGYRLTVDRYGAPRVGRAVAIYVTEPFSRSKHVKLDDAAAAKPDDLLDVLKLNLVRSFQTGIYDYHTMLSLFVTAHDFAPVKVAFSSSEWCGQVYEQLDFAGDRVAVEYKSYFEGESNDQTLPVPAGALTEDDLFVRLRGLRGAYLEPGAARTVPFLASPFIRRLAHRALAFGTATIERSPEAESVTVPAGKLVADVYTVKVSDGRVGRFHVERDEPHRIVRWAWTVTPDASPGAHPLGGTDAGELTGTSREPYWREHAPGDERLLERIGLAPAVVP